MRFLWMTVILLAAGYQDMRERKISNILILSGLFGICIFRYMAEGREGLVKTGLSCILMIGIFYPLFLIHAFGAGDIKLISLVSAMQGIREALQVCILWFLLAGAASLWKLLSKHRLKQRLAYAWQYLRSGLISGMPYYDKKLDGAENTIPLAPFLAVAYGLTELGRWRGVW